MSKAPDDRTRPRWTAEDCAQALGISRPSVCWWVKRLAIKRVAGITPTGSPALLFSLEQYEELREAVTAAGQRPGSKRGAGMGRTPGRPTARRRT